MSSSDLIADRRFVWARGYAAAGDHAAAAELLAQVVERVPAWGPGWAALGEARERSGDPAGAREAWGRAAALDAAGALGAQAHLARLDGTAPERLPEPYLRALFDDYAPRFDRHLTTELGYRGPAVVLEALDRAAPGRRFARALDLGCGTGLMGLALRDRAGRIDGVDLSPAMADRARATGVYAELTVGPLESLLAAAAPGAYDLVVAADVFVYLGSLAPVCAAAVRALRPGGLLAFTVQGAADAAGPWLGPDMRYRHGRRHVEGALSDAGFGTALLEAASTRREGSEDVPGLAVVAERRPTAERPA